MQLEQTLGLLAENKIDLREEEKSLGDSDADQGGANPSVIQSNGTLPESLILQEIVWWIIIFVSHVSHQKLVWINIKAIGIVISASNEAPIWRLQNIMAEMPTFTASSGFYTQHQTWQDQMKGTCSKPSENQKKHYFFVEQSCAHGGIKSEAVLERKQLWDETSASHDSHKDSHAPEVALIEQEGIAVKEEVIPSLKGETKIFNEHSKIHF